MKYHIVSILHTKRTDRYITFWRPDSKGYAWAIPWAGEYDPEVVTGNPSYFNSGGRSGTIAVSTEAVKKLQEASRLGDIDGGSHPIVRNTASNWWKLMAATISQPQKIVRPQFRGALKEETK